MAAGPVDQLASFLRPVLWFITLVSRAITGGRGARAPYLTEEELMTMLHVSEEQATAYWLYRVYAFAKEPRIYRLKGSLKADALTLEPTVYRATR